MPYKTIKLSKLQINPENDRFEPVANEKEAIDSMLTKLGGKIYRLAEHILKHNLSPKPFYVIPNGNKFLVKDGNRRTTALKLMARPSLINEKKFPQLKKRFVKLHSQYKNTPINTIMCYVYEHQIQADQWVKLEHTGEQGGIGVVDWDSEQIQRFDSKHGKLPSLAIQIIDFLKQSPFVETEVLSLLDKIAITNLQRLIVNPNIRKKLGIDVKDKALRSDIEESELVKGLTTLIKNIAQPSFNVKDIYTTKLANEYINKIAPDELPDLSKRADNTWSLLDPMIDIEEEENGNSPKTTKKKNGNGVIPLTRKTLIPKTCSISITNIKVNKIYNELQRIDIKSFTNCAAVTLRVFIELSIDTYLEKKKLLPPDKASASKCGMNLFQKVSKVCDHLAKQNCIDDTTSKGIKTITKDSNSLWGIDTIQAYLHNNQLSPIPDNVLTTWDNIQEFMVSLWNNIEISE